MWLFWVADLLYLGLVICVLLDLCSIVLLGILCFCFVAVSPNLLWLVCCFDGLWMFVSLLVGILGVVLLSVLCVLLVFGFVYCL